MNLSYAIGFLLLCISHARSLHIITEKPPPFAFSIDFSTKKPTLQQISLHGGAKLDHSSVRFSAPESSVVYSKPVSSLGNNPTSGFTTYFSFSTFPDNVVNFGELGFFLFPHNNGNGDSLIEWNRKLQLGIPPNAISVTLVSTNKTENFIRIKVGADIVAQSSGLSSPSLFGQLHCLIHYNGVSKRMEVKVSESKEMKSMSASLSYPVNLTSQLLNQKLSVGMRYSCKNLTQGITLNSWSFSTDEGVNIHSMHSEPLDPRAFVVASSEDHPHHHRKGLMYPWGILVAVVSAAALAVLLVWYTIVSAWKSVSDESVTSPVQSGYRRMLLLEGENVNGCLELEDLS